MEKSNENRLLCQNMNRISFEKTHARYTMYSLKHILNESMDSSASRSSTLLRGATHIQDVTRSLNKPRLTLL